MGEPRLLPKATPNPLLYAESKLSAWLRRFIGVEEVHLLSK
jgi:hypothetical protein